MGKLEPKGSLPTEGAGYLLTGLVLPVFTNGDALV